MPLSLCIKAGPFAFGKGLHHSYDQGHYGQIGTGTLLNIEQANFDGPAIEAGNGATRIQKILFQQAFFIVGRNGAAYGIEYLRLIVALRIYGFGNYAACNNGEALLIETVVFQTGIPKSGIPPVENGGAGGQGRQQGQNQTNGGV